MNPILKATSPQVQIPQDSLQSAISSGSREKVKALLESNPALIHSRLENGKLPLHFSISQHQTDVTAFLVERTDPFQTDREKINALDHAVIANDSDVAEKIFQQMNKQRTAIQKEVANALKDEDWEKTESILDNLDSKTLAHEFAKVEVFRYQLSRMVKFAAENQGIDAEQISQRQLELSKPNRQNITPLEKAIRYQNWDVFFSLLSWGADVNYKTHDGHSLLWLALENNSTDMVHFLLHAGHRLNETDSKESLFSLALAKKNMKVVYLLLAYGAIPSAEDKKAIFALCKTHDPLFINGKETWLFLTSMAYWLAQGSLAFNTNSYAQYLPTAIHLVGSAAIATSVLFDIKKSWKWGVTFLGMTALESLPTFSLGLQAWRTAQATVAAFIGIRAAHNNYADRPGPALRKGFVHAVNAAHSAYMLKKICAYSLQANDEVMWERGGKELFKKCNSSNLSRSEKFDCRLIRNRHNCPEINPEAYKNSSLAEILSSPEFKEHCSEHAKLIFKDFESVKETECAENIHSCARSLVRNLKSDLTTNTTRNTVPFTYHPDKMFLSRQEKLEKSEFPELPYFLNYFKAIAKQEKESLEEALRGQEAIESLPYIVRLFILKSQKSPPHVEKSFLNDSEIEKLTEMVAIQQNEALESSQKVLSSEQKVLIEKIYQFFFDRLQNLGKVLAFSTVRDPDFANEDFMVNQN